jgi:N-acetylmuramoyl-L-alanine amidase
MSRLLFLALVLNLCLALAAQKPMSLNTVVIDAGHGGKDPGALGAKVREKDVTLAVALKLGQYITENFPDVKVVYTRSKDVFVELDQRAIIANKNKADLFISIHANSISKPAISGTETFVLGLHRSQDNLEVAKKENSVIVLEENYTAKYEGFDPNSSESYIIFELMQNAYLDQSIYFAKMVEEQFSTKAGRTSRGVKQAGFLVLRETAMPSVLVELGYLTNAREESFLGTADGQSVLASAVFRAFRDYKASYDAKTSLEIGATHRPADTTQGETRKPAETASPKDTNVTISVKPTVKTQTVSTNIVFRVQIATNVKPLSNNQPPLSGFDNVWMYKDKGAYKYTVGQTSQYNEILKVLSKAKQKVPDAFVVSFEGENRIPLDDALAKLGVKR